MARAMKRHKRWLIPLSVVVIGAGLFVGWQRIHAQGEVPTGPPPGAGTQSPGMPAAPGAGPGLAVPAPSPAEPTHGLNNVLPAGIRVMRIKNWDGTVTELLRFKYRTLDGRVTTVHLPRAYKNERMTRAAWDTLFMCYAMDYEARIAEMEKQAVPNASAVSAFVAELQSGSAGLPAQPAWQALGAMDFARSQLPSIGMGPISPPPALPGLHD